ncbi:MAG: GNAT family N-acetyltransferase [Thermotogota bacterium]
MSEFDAIRRTKGLPITAESLTADLRALGVASGDVLLVHSSLSALGWVCGGAVAVIEALLAAVGPAGTLVMPSCSGGLTDPREWRNPPVPEEWKDLIRKTMPAYDPARTPTYSMGVIPEAFRTWPGVVRSQHPYLSFAACGPAARRIVDGHTVDYGLGEGSPLARIYDLDGAVLLLGVGHESNTSMHLAEYRVAFFGKRETTNGAPVVVAGKRVWTQIVDVDCNSDDFGRIAAAYVESGGDVRARAVGAGRALWMKQRPLVDFAAEWMVENRGRSTPGEEVRIRPLASGDRGEWGCLRAALWPGHGRGELEQEMDAMLSAAETERAFVAELASGGLCGVVEASLRLQAEGCTTSPVGYVEGLYVDPSWRRRGLGRRLVEEAEMWARSLGCREMASDTTSEYPDSLAVHRALGYEVTRSSQSFRKGLRP